MHKTISLFCLFCLLCGALSSCSAVQTNPGSDLWGTWAFESQQDGNSAYFSDLEFQPMAPVIDQTGGSAVDYVVIAPGRIKLTRQGQSEVLNYDLSADTLTLRFDKGHNVYTRSAPAVPVASLPTQPPISAPTQPKPVENIIEKLFSDKPIISPENATQVTQLELLGKGLSMNSLVS